MSLAKHFTAYQLLASELAHERELRAAEVGGLKDLVLGQSVEIQRLKSEILRLERDCKAKDDWNKELVRMQNEDWRENAYRLQHPNAATPREKLTLENGAVPRQPVSAPSHNIRSIIHEQEAALRTKAAESGHLPFIPTAFDLAKKKAELEKSIAAEVAVVAKVNGI